MSLTAALLNGDIVDPEDEEDDDDGPLNPSTLKQEWEKMSAPNIHVLSISMTE
ncbi:hypothetical protein DPX16_4603 [Anabarilius grahami]|uniref:Uncharacterized protein n=1 Tax=Anabarilius grahami TaxID=495550 RepID=A0A3N0YC00_ANAGA|nr:hypothetical protein DPX16_4603 [Anabarilius grahami]